MLGADLAAACAADGYEVRVYDLPEFDITNSAHVQEAVCAADAIINCAAYTDVDGAESQAEVAHRVNAEAVGRLGTFASEHGKWVLHFSTDFVFDGALDRPYVETDVPGPINEYGRSKLAGEQLLRASGCSHCLVRLEWTYGAHGTNFVTKLVEQARAGGTLQVVDDQIGSPCCSGDYPMPARRPLNSRFDCTKIHELLGHPIEPWKGPLEHFLRPLDAKDSGYRRCGIHRQ